MRHIVSQIEKEWLILVLADEFDGFIGIAASEQVLISRPLDDFCVMAPDRTLSNAESNFLMLEKQVRMLLELVEHSSMIQGKMTSAAIAHLTLKPNMW